MQRESALNYNFQDTCSLYNLLLLAEISQNCFHYRDCHPVKIRQACFDYIRMFETSQFACQDKVDARRFIGVGFLIAGWFFNEVF